MSTIDLSQYGIKPITLNNTNNTQQLNNQSISNLTYGLKQPQTLNTIKLNDGTTLIHIGSYQEPVTENNSIFNNNGLDYKKLFGDDATLVHINGQTYVKQSPTFFQKYGNYINAGMGLAQLGLGIGSYIENRSALKRQRNLLKEQLFESKEEFDRLNNIRSKINAEFQHKQYKPISRQQRAKDVAEGKIE